jgi:hypothetical protein
MSGARGCSKRQKMQRLPPGQVWRSIDFWSWGLLNNKSIQMSAYRQKQLDGNTLLEFQKAERDQKFPADFFVDVKNWYWSVKEDGYFVKLIRDEKNKWSMTTRLDTLLNPPPSFLKGLENNLELPNMMFGELITSFTECEPQDRGDIGKRTVLRNKQFAKLNKIFPRGKQLTKCKPKNWEGLRVKIFSFPLSEVSIGDTYKKCCKTMAKTLQYHPHIGMCRAGLLHSTQHAIEIFNAVVQMGLEGIVIVDPSVQYGTLMDRHGDPAYYFFKLKQKIVLPPTQIVQGKIYDRFKDGEIAPPEYEYTLTEDKEIKFSDQQNRDTDFKHRLKYMEHVPGMTGFPCMTGYRHMHFATPYDMSVAVPADVSLTRVQTVQHVLGVDYAKEKIKKDGILNWDIPEEKKELEKSEVLIRLYNPRPFEPIQSDFDFASNYSKAGASASSPRKRDSSDELHKPKETTRKIGRWASGVWENQYTVKHNHGDASSKAAGSKDKESTEKEKEWWESSDSDNDDNDPKPSEHENEHDGESSKPATSNAQGSAEKGSAEKAIKKNSVDSEQENDSQPWPEPSPEDSPEVHKKWASRPPPYEKDSRAVKKAWDDMLLWHYRKAAKEATAREAAEEAAREAKS